MSELDQSAKLGNEYRNLCLTIIDKRFGLSGNERLQHQTWKWFENGNQTASEKF